MDVVSLNIGHDDDDDIGRGEWRGGFNRGLEKTFRGRVMLRSGWMDGWMEMYKYLDIQDTT